MATLAEVRQRLANGEKIVLPRKFAKLFQEDVVKNPSGTDESFRMRPVKGGVEITDVNALNKLGHS